MALTVAHRAKAYALLEGTAGADATHTMQAGRFHRTRDPVESVEANIVERAAQVVIDPPTPIAGYNNPLDGRDLSPTRKGDLVGQVLASRDCAAGLPDGLGRGGGGDHQGSRDVQRDHCDHRDGRSHGGCQRRGDRPSQPAGAIADTGPRARLGHPGGTVPGTEERDDHKDPAHSFRTRHAMVR